MRVRCQTLKTPDGRNADLIPGKICKVLGIEAGDLCLLDDTGSPVLFDPGTLKMVEGSRLTDWVSKIIDSVEYAGPLKFSHPGFLEDLHKHDPATVRPSPDISTGN